MKFTERAVVRVLIGALRVVGDSYGVCAVGEVERGIAMGVL